eukprot:966744-Prymnesium_polylepis.1
MDWKFRGPVVAEGGQVVFTPASASCVGVFDAASSAFACADISATLSSGGKFAGAAAALHGDIVFAARNADCVGVFSLTACDPTVCPVGYYRANCLVPGLDSGISALTSCAPCTNAPADHYCTTNGGLYDACVTAACSDLPACAAGSRRIGCGGAYAGVCQNMSAVDFSCANIASAISIDKKFEGATSAS